MTGWTSEVGEEGSRERQGERVREKKTTRKAKGRRKRERESVI